MPQLFPRARLQPRIIQATAPLRLWHLASLDAPTVALAWSLAFAWAAHIQLPLWVPILLLLTVWPVYIADRLLDARSALCTAQIHRLRHRHFFHHRYRCIFTPLAIASAAAATGIVFTLMPPIARERNSILAAASLVYFTRVHTGRTLAPLLPRFLSKELLVGLLFTAGCTLPALTRVSTRAATPTVIGPLQISAVAFALLAWLNCHAIDRWESAPDARISSRAILLAFASFLLAAFLFNTHPRSAALLLAATASALLLALLDQYRAHLTPITLRAAADLSLLTPAFLLVIR